MHLPDLDFYLDLHKIKQSYQTYLSDALPWAMSIKHVENKFGNFSVILLIDRETALKTLSPQRKLSLIYL